METFEVQAFLARSLSSKPSPSLPRFPQFLFFSNQYNTLLFCLGNLALGRCVSSGGGLTPAGTSMFTMWEWGIYGLMDGTS